MFSERSKENIGEKKGETKRYQNKFVLYLYLSDFIFVGLNFSLRKTLAPASKISPTQSNKVLHVTLNEAVESERISKPFSTTTRKNKVLEPLRYMPDIELKSSHVVII